MKITAATPDEREEQAARDLVAAARDLLNSAEEKLDEVLRSATLPEPRPHVEVIVFEKKFATTGPTYRYAAISANGVWFVTGAKAPNGVTWLTLDAFIHEDNLLEPAYQTTYTDQPF